MYTYIFHLCFRANIQDIIKDCTMVPDATPTVDKKFIWLKREDFRLWNIKVYNQTHTHLDYKRYTSVQDLANGNLFSKIFDFNAKDTPESMIEQQIREIVRTLIFIYSSGPGTSEWANTNDIYDHCYETVCTYHFSKDNIRRTGKLLRGISYTKDPKSVRECASYCSKQDNICIYLKKI